MEMTKWFDTNYHYIVPEFREGQKFTLASPKVINEFQEAFQLGIKTKPVILGPVTFLITWRRRHVKNSTTRRPVIMRRAVVERGLIS